MTKILFTIATLLAVPESQAKTLTASWYEQGTITASGERFNPSKLTVAHRSLPFGTKLRLRYKTRQIIATVNDRGPFIKGRQIDLSKGAAKALKLEGVQKIELVEVIPSKKTSHKG